MLVLHAFYSKRRRTCEGMNELTGIHVGAVSASVRAVSLGPVAAMVASASVPCSSEPVGNVLPAAGSSTLSVAQSRRMLQC